MSLKEILYENRGKYIILKCFKDNPVIKLYERLEAEKIEETHYIFEKYIVIFGEKKAKGQLQGYRK